jgi:ribosome maturation factor RimP
MLAPSVEALGCELLGVQLSRGPRQSQLRIYIDRPEGVSLEDCERVSHQVSGILDVEDPIEGQYSLEVSSPGADRPLFLEEHFRRFAGHQVRLRLAVPLEGRRNLTGRLEGMDDGEVLVALEGRQWRLPLEQIAQARLVPELSGP